MRIAQVGLGGWGRSWAHDVVPLVPGVELVAGADLAPQSLGSYAKEGILPPDHLYGSLETALEAEVLDAVLVTTGLSSHVPVVRAALEAGKHVLVEKPFAPSVEEARLLVALAEERGLTLMVSQNYRFFPAVRRAQRLVKERTFGEVRHVEIQFRRFSPADKGADGLHVMRDPLLVEMAVHHFDLLRATLGRRPLSVSCRTWNPAWSWFAHNAEASATIVFEGGLTACYMGSWLSPDATHWAGQWRFALDCGELCWTSRADLGSGLEGEDVRFCDRRGRWKSIALEPLKHYDRAGCLHEFVSCLAEARAPECDGRDNLWTLAMVRAALASASASGVEVAVEL